MNPDRPTKLTIEHAGEEWRVTQENGENVWPTTAYPTARKALARALQLLDIGPVGPQTWPEEVCIGTLDMEPRAPFPSAAPAPPVGQEATRTPPPFEPAGPVTITPEESARITAEGRDLRREVRSRLAGTHYEKCPLCGLATNPPAPAGRPSVPAEDGFESCNRARRAAEAEAYSLRAGILRLADEWERSLGYSHGGTSHVRDTVKACALQLRAALATAGGKP